VFETAFITEGHQRTCQDRVGVFHDLRRVVIVVCDGAGGSGAGEQAAAAVVEQVRRRFKATNSPRGWCEVLRETDSSISCGESTAVVVDVCSRGICGASVGDSQAWVVKEGEINNLTAGQRRKPLLGSGEATPVEFTYHALHGLFLVATDGFCNYVRRPELLKVLPYLEFPVVPKRLLDMVRLRSGELWDDVGTAVCRRSPKRRHERVTLGIRDLV